MTSEPRFGCPRGHTDSITASYTIDIEVPADLVQEPDDDTTNTDLNKCQTDNWSFNGYYCPTCEETFEELVTLDKATS
jgi:hypothetical protein